MRVLSHLPWSIAFAVSVFGVSSARAEGPAAKLDVTIEAGIVSDYRFRGISLSDREPAVQGSLTVGLGSGLYSGVWASTSPADGNDGDVELELYVGYSTESATGLGGDFSIMYYSYPGQSEFNYFEATAAFSYKIGVVTPKVEISFAPGQDAVRDDFGRRRGNFYASTGLDVAIPGTKLTLSGQIGRESGPFDTNSDGAKWDWQAGGTVEAGALTLSLAYCDSDATVANPEGKNLSGGTLIASALFSF